MRLDSGRKAPKRNQLLTTVQKMNFPLTTGEIGRSGTRVADPGIGW